MILNRYSEEYFDYLCNLVLIGPMVGYEKLARYLSETDYIWSVMCDDNREADGLEIRNEFLQMKRYNKSFIEGKCSVLEMLIALCRRIDDICFDSVTGEQMKDWFWKLLHNLGLDDFSDANWNRLNGDIMVKDILNIWLTRKYRKDGQGGIFPVKRSREDQRTIEIFRQMNQYLLECEYRL